MQARQTITILGEKINRRCSQCLSNARIVAIKGDLAICYKCAAKSSSAVLQTASRAYTAYKNSPAREFAKLCQTVKEYAIDKGFFTDLEIPRIQIEKIQSVLDYLVKTGRLLKIKDLYWHPICFELTKNPYLRSRDLKIFARKYKVKQSELKDCCQLYKQRIKKSLEVTV